MSSSTTSNNSKYNKDKDIFEIVQHIFGFYLIPIICLPGLIGNILCISVFLSNTMKRYSTTQFLLYLAISDTFKLSNDLLYSLVLIIQSIHTELGKELFHNLYRYCHYINQCATICTAWLTLTLAIERYILCSCQTRIGLDTCFKKNTKLICCTILLISLLIGLPVSGRYELVESELNNSTSKKILSIQLSTFGKSRAFRLYSMTVDIIRAIIPSLLLIYINSRIVYLLCRMKEGIFSKEQRHSQEVFYRLTISLIIIIFCFIISYFPDALLSLILNMGYIEEPYQKRTIREITDFFVTLNSATNFTIYFCISYTFRRSLARLIAPTKKYYTTTDPRNEQPLALLGRDENIIN
ncbi:unnamed protein product [Didymodactylos carnosus]|uniref:G-protein coupled receptors family 1 profile domain-containing protein n=1 Tax=Didymodactylos carnosus TaxID=1234261 RepID=A0A814C0M4_9BILA|nr:unnamed protein product [Didymodactylos carnosus]CAF1242653.1 unnamed protein product [Didymodactylos carnosus]CAF3714444.1 unnamed protein product [Didymodactylos carnosus]CAF4050172.1 unnamed protein product [Didymodactylos carnosus]